MASKFTALFLAVSALLIAGVISDKFIVLSSRFFQVKVPRFQGQIVEKGLILQARREKDGLQGESLESGEADLDKKANIRLLLSSESGMTQEAGLQADTLTNYEKRNEVSKNTYVNDNHLQTPLKTLKSYQNTQNTLKIKNPVPTPSYLLNTKSLSTKTNEHKQKIQMVYRNIRFQSHAIDYQQQSNAVSWREIVNEDLEQITPKMKAEYDYYEQKYSISSYDQLPFCIVVPTYNNRPDNRYLTNIRSIVMQNYSNFHIVVIDDGSTDGTGELISQFLQTQNQVSRYNYEVIRNEEQKKAMFNLRRAALEYCRPNEIFLIVDGDDELLGRQVLKLFNSLFQKTGAWFVYSNFVFNNGNVGYSRPFPKKVIEDHAYRQYYFITSHLRAYYTQLFVNIKEEDLRDQRGNYFSAANDVAICLPVLEQAHRRVQYVPELTYHYNANTGQNNHMVRAFQQKENDRVVRNRPSYAPLEQLFGKQQK